MADLVLIPLPGVGTLELPREVYERHLRPMSAPENAQAPPPTELVTAKAMAHQTSLPLSCIYEYAKAGRIPSVRVGKHVRFNAAQVLSALRATDTVAVGRA